MAEGFPSEHFDALVPHPFDQAVAEMMDAQARIDEERVANECGVNDAQRILDYATDPEINVLRDTKNHMDKFEVPNADAEDQASYIVAMEAHQIVAEALLAAWKALRDEATRPSNVYTKKAGRFDMSAGHLDMQKLAADALDGNTQRDVARSKSESIESMPKSDAARIREIIENYRAPGDRRRRQGYDPNNPHDPRNP